MIGKNIVLNITIALALSLAFTGCGKSDSGGSAQSGGSSSAGDGGGGAGGGSSAAPATGAPKEAMDAVQAELGRHWAKVADGWITARVSGSPYSPDHFLRELHDITETGAEPFDLSDSDRLNGTEWNGQVTFKQSPCREAGDVGTLLDGLANITPTRQPGKWTAWADWQPDPVHVWKAKGKWQIEQDTWLLRGNIPTAADYAKAAVK
jgi:hypothetical protein